MGYRTGVLWTILPLAPLALGFVVLGLVDQAPAGLAGHLPGPGSFFTDNRELRFFNALLGYLAVALAHVAACVAVTVVFCIKLWHLPRPVQIRSLAIFAATLVLLAGIGMLVRQEGNTGALNLGYRYVCMVLSSADVARHIVPPDCTGGGLSRLAWFALGPLLAGLLAAALASAVTSTNFAPLDSEDPAGALQRRSASIEQTFRAVAFILVTSTLALVLFYRLPLALIADEGAALLWTGYAQGITFFWGVLFTLTLVCVFGTGALLMSAEQRRHMAAGMPLQLPDALTAREMRHQIAKILTTLAPLLIGASGSVLETIAGVL